MDTKYLCKIAASSLDRFSIFALVLSVTGNVFAQENGFPEGYHDWYEGEITREFTLVVP